jgi:S1-C subfamily serine protease
VTRALLIVALACAALVAGCTRDEENGQGQNDQAETPTRTVERTKVEVVESGGAGEGFDARAVFDRVGGGVVTILSLFEERNIPDNPLGGNDDEDDEDDEQGGQGSGFVISENGEVLTNAHVVTTGEGKDIKEARDVYVRFPDGNQVEAKIVGHDPNADVALLKIDPAGLTLRPVPLGSVETVKVGDPVAAIGSPFGEERSLSTGIVSALDRTIDSLTGFGISGAVQTDAAINRGNSGGPLVDAKGRLIGINSQIRSASGGSEGIGYAVSVETVRRSLEQLRETGEVRYPYLGVATQDVYPQAAEEFELGVERGAWVQEVVKDGPADDAGIEAGKSEKRFQAQTFRTGGDVVVKVGQTAIRDADDLSQALNAFRPGETVPLEVVREGERRTIRVKLGERPAESDPAG